MTATCDVLELADDWGPEKIVAVTDTRTGMRGVLIIDNTARGAGKGGTRMAPSVSVPEVARLARVMTWKWAVTGLFFGGAKAGIRFDPESPRKEEVLRAFVRALCNEVPAEYVFGLDMGLSEEDAAVIQDEARDRGASTGTPAALGGIPYDQLGITGYGVAESVRQAAARRGIALEGARVAIQGFGAVGSAVAKRLCEFGMVLVAVSTASGAVRNDAGFEVNDLLDLRAAFGDTLVDHLPGRKISLGEELEVAAEVVVPAASQDAIDGAAAKRIQAKLVVEAANLPTTPEARSSLFASGVTLVPDIVANPGGAIAAAYAMDALHSAFPINTADVLANVATRIRDSTDAVLDAASKTDTAPHDAAYILARKRVERAMAARGRLPAYK